MFILDHSFILKIYFKNIGILLFDKSSSLQVLFFSNYFYLLFYFFLSFTILNCLIIICRFYIVLYCKYIIIFIFYIRFFVLDRIFFLINGFYMWLEYTIKYILQIKSELFVVDKGRSELLSFLYSKFLRFDI